MQNKERLENSSDRITITAALPYTNGPVHIGHLAGVYIPADIYVRYLRLNNKDVAFVCGSDEHGVPITLKAKKEGRPVADGEFQTACSNACSSGAMVFGDINDKTSKITHMSEDDRSFKLLDFVGTKPNVFYQLKVKNTNES